MIQLQHIRPEPLFSKPNPPTDSMVWNQDLRFERNTNYLIKAPSGGGKSTLVHIIFGLRKDFEGDIFFDQQQVNTAKPEVLSQIRKEQLSIVFQDLRLLPQLTGWENIEISRSLQEHKTSTQIREMAELLGASSFLEQKTATLSYGQKQRIAIIRALSKPFSFLLLDEPFSHLDENNINAACQLISQELKNNNAGLVLVSHESPYSFTIDKTLIL